MSCLFYCCTKRTYFYAFLFLYRFFGNSSDHGMIFSSKSAVSLFPVILVSMYSIYSYGFRPFIFALSIMLYAAPLALAPLMLFSTSTKGAEASAAVFSLIETAKANKLNPYDYIEFILDYLPQQDLVEDPKKLDWFLPWSEEIKEEFEIKAD